MSAAPEDDGRNQPFLAQLTWLEVDYLCLLMSTNVVARAKLAGADDASIGKLRKKMKSIGASIKTVSGGGLRLDARSKAKVRMVVGKQLDAAVKAS